MEKKLIVFLIFITFSSDHLAYAENSLYALAYHGFSESPGIYEFTTNELDAHLKFLKDAGFRFVSYEDFSKGNVWGEMNVMIFVDDGYKNLKSAMPVFKRFDVMPVIGVIAQNLAYTGKDYLTVSSLLKMKDEGAYLASHSMTHKRMGFLGFLFKEASLDSEIIKSRDAIEKELKIKTDVFVYPYGFNNQKIRKTIRLAGYSYAFTIRGGKIVLPVKKRDAFSLPRYMLTRFNVDILFFRLKNF